MKLHLILPSIAVLVIQAVSCSREPVELLSSEQILAECQALLSSDFVKTDSGVIDFSATLEDVLQMGLHEESYYKFLKDVENMNSFFSARTYDYQLEVYDASSERLNIETKVGSEPSGVINAFDNGPVTSYFWAPHGVLALYCWCYSSGPLPMFSVETMAFGGTQSKTRVGYGALVVPISASGCQVRIKFQTTDSNGGNCSWHSLYQSDLTSDLVVEMEK